MNDRATFVRGFRGSAPYIHTSPGRVFVVQFDGDALLEAQFSALVHDMALLHSLGVKLVIVHGFRPQIEDRLKLRGLESQFVDGVRVTGADALDAVVDAAGSVRTEVEALLSMGLANSPMHGAGVRVASGNFVTARPMGIRDGVDFAFTGEVRRVDTEAIERRLGDGSIVLVSALGYSPSGEVFNMRAEDVATEIAVELKAQKLLMLRTGEWIESTSGALARQLTVFPTPARLWAKGRPRTAMATTMSVNSSSTRCAPVSTASHARIFWITAWTVFCCWSSSPAMVSARW